MTKKLYVGNLSYSTTEDDLHKLFTQVGPVVSVALITDRMTGQSKGFGFVEMETEKAAQDAIQRLNSQELNQRSITVSEARPPKDRPSFGGGGGGRGGSGGRRRRRQRDRSLAAGRPDCRRSAHGRAAADAVRWPALCRVAASWRGIVSGVSKNPLLDRRY
ncbi:MAG: RNA-binding protein, partial [Anaerolineales bacterium]|nr:RNA-binding protein [Anaerolineales bacterium]